MLNPELSTPLQVLHKLEREMHRAFHHRNYMHKADHFFNFCITALSLKDVVLHHLGLTTDTDKSPYYEKWSNVDCLKAATEIANTAKHFQLRKFPDTKAVERTRSIVVNVLIGPNGELKNVEENAPDLKVILSDDSEINLYEFTREVIDYWKDYLNTIGIKYVHQDEHTFFGDDEP